MAKLQVKNLSAASVGEVELKEQLTETPLKQFMIRDAVVRYMNGQRQGTHSTKTRKWVHGTTRKPWKQKGTGRARAGSVKSPLWRHGAITHGPLPRDYSQDTNKKEKKMALRSALAEKIRGGDVIVVDSLKTATHKTKDLIKSLNAMQCLKKTLLVVDQIERNTDLAARNLPTVLLTKQLSLTVYKLLLFDKIVIEKNALLALEQRLVS